MKTIYFILFGAPASGKGYLGEKIKQEILKQNLVTENEIAYISTGDLLREEMAAKTDLGLKIADLINDGQLVPDEIVDTLVEKALTGSQKVMFLDGYPRTRKQLINLTAVLYSLKDPALIVSLKREISFSVIRERAANRRICKDCRSTHTADDGICPKCGGPLITREDDLRIDKRLTTYVKQTAELWPDLRELADIGWLIPAEKDADIAAEAIVSACIKVMSE